MQQRIADRQVAIQVADVRRQIIIAANDYDKVTLEALLEHSLRPIDPGGYEAFRRSMMDLVAAKAASGDPRAAGLEASSETTVPPLEAANSKKLVALFDGPDRLRASNALAQLYESKPDETVAALIAGVIPESPQRNSYRVNLYVAFTLGRLRPFWKGTEAQRQTIKRLKQHTSYRDPTFKLRVDQALATFRP